VTAQHLGGTLLLASAVVFSLGAAITVGDLQSEGPMSASGTLLLALSMLCGAVAATILAANVPVQLNGGKAGNGFASVGFGLGALCLFELLTLAAVDPAMLLIFIFLLFVGFGAILGGAIILVIAMLRTAGAPRMIAVVFLISAGMIMLGIPNPPFLTLLGLAGGIACWVGLAILAIASPESPGVTARSGS